MKVSSLYASKIYGITSKEKKSQWMRYREISDPDTCYQLLLGLRLLWPILMSYNNCNFNFVH